MRIRFRLRWQQVRDYFSKRFSSLLLLGICATVIWFELAWPICVRLFIWPSIPQTTGSKKAITVLIAADPQLQGYKNELQFWGYFTRFDADRYLSLYFGWAFGYSNPDIVIFLGDLLDEGSTADKNEFAFAVSRFRKIFKAARNVKRIFIAGDNDIGGEGGEKVDATRKIWFSEAFDNEEAPPAKPKSDFVQFFEANYFTNEVQPLDIHGVSSSSNILVRILLSHVSLLNHDAKELMDPVNPNIILSAHSHLPAYMYRLKLGDKLHQIDLLKRGQHRPSMSIKHIDNNFYYEFTVPTCSYRMGVPNMGYGILVLEVDTANLNSNLKSNFSNHTYNNYDNNDLNKITAHFLILWLPGRYPQLFAYLLWLLILCGVLLVIGFRRLIALGTFSYTHRRGHNIPTHRGSASTFYYDYASLYR